MTYVSKSTAIALKEKGYDEFHVWIYTERDRLVLLNHDECNSSLTKSVTAPDLNAAADWLRERGVHVHSAPHKSSFWYGQIYQKNDQWEFMEGVTDSYPTHAQALESAIVHGLKYVK